MSRAEICSCTLGSNVNTPLSSNKISCFRQEHTLKTLLVSAIPSSFPRLSCDRPITSSKASSQQRGPPSAPDLKFQVSLPVPKAIQQLLTSSSSRYTLKLGTVYVYVACLYMELMVAKRHLYFIYRQTIKFDSEKKEQYDNHSNLTLIVLMWRIG